MKNTSIITLAALLLGSTGAFAQQEAVTKPAGFVSLGNSTSGQPAVAANTDLFISVPLLPATASSGKVDAPVAADKLTFQSPVSFTTDQWVGAPHCVVVTSGANEGLMAVISSHTSNEVTLMIPDGMTLTGIVAGDTVKIVPCWTASSLFASSVIPAGTNLYFYSVADGEINASAKIALVYSGSNWFYSFDLVNGQVGNANDFIIHPGEGFVLRTGGSSITSLLVIGSVPITKHSAVISKSMANAQEDNIVGYLSPVGEKMSATGLGFSAGDTMLIFDNQASGINKSAQVGLVYSGTNWFYSFDLLDNQTGSADDYVLKAGTAFVIRRAASASVGDVNWSKLQSYVPGLNN